MKWLLFILMVVIATPAVAQDKSATAKDPVTQEELQKNLDDVKNMMEQLKDELKGDLKSTKVEALDAMKEAIESAKAEFGVTNEQLMGIASGAVIGAIVIDLAGGGGIATLIGSVLGGTIGNWLMTPTDTLDDTAAASKQKINASVEQNPGLQNVSTSAAMPPSAALGLPL
jgi:F0F1-type ATP synthase assembly protein I